MKYIVKIADAEYGPIDELTLLKWVDEDRINRDTEITAKLIKNWRKASDLDFLKEVLAEQNERFKTEGVAGYEEVKETAWGRFKVAIWGQIEEKAFAMSYKPDFARLSARLNAFCFDFFILILVFILLAIVGMYGAFKFATINTASNPLEPQDNLIATTIEKTSTEKKLSEGEPITDNDKSKVPAAADNTELLKGVAKDLESKADEATQKVMGKFRGKIKTTSQALKANLSSVNAPSIFADSSAGYKTGYIWVNTADNNHRYICLSANEGSARWIEVSELGKFFTLATICWLPILLLYYGISLGYFAQSPGMWYFGIFICNRNQKETYFFRAFCFTILMLIFGILMPLSVLAFKRGVHDLLCGVYVYSVVAKKPT